MWNESQKGVAKTQLSQRPKNPIDSVRLEKRRKCYLCEKKGLFLSEDDEVYRYQTCPNCNRTFKYEIAQFTIEN